MLSSQHTCSVQADPYVDSKIIFVIQNCRLYLHLKYVYFYEGIAIKSWGNFTSHNSTYLRLGDHA